MLYMYKVVILLGRRPGLSHEEFMLALRVHIRPLIRSLPGVSRIVVSDAIAGPGRPPAYDAIGEFWFDDIAAVRALTESAEARQIEAAMEEFVDMDRYEPLLTVERDITEAVHQ
jgi:uncharacterized protein (TIGR02118 family)